MARGTTTDWLNFADAFHSNTVTVFIWGKWTDTTTNAGLSGKWVSNEWIIWQEPTTRDLAWRSKDCGANKNATTLTDHNDGVWHGIAGGHDGTNVRMYVDAGAFDITGDASTVIDNTTSQISVGNYQTTDNQALDGDWAEVAAWSDWLSNAHLDALFHGVPPFVIRPDILLFHAPLHGNLEPEPEYKQTGNGTFTNTPIKANHPPIQLLSRYI